MNKLNWLIHPLILSTKTLGTSFLLFILIGTPIAYLLAFYNGKFKAFFETIVMFPLIFPPIATGFLLLYLLGRNGIIGKALNLEIAFSFNALILASFLAGLPLFVKPVAAALENFPKTLIEAAQSLGKNRAQIALFVMFPNIFKSVLAALILALARGLGEVGITLMLGGNIVGKTDTVSLAIFNAVYDGENEQALILSLILVILSIIMFGIINFLNSRRK
ncbi:molybdate ABC transporter permease subunit [Campylobacter californiensis]|uniref:molybdate ABC transporter permease subunit n=1 Tax=Campylobacter californiensis TaxID=1032243 RepID=UPI001475B000|nr:ABC transporter permease subunit [Campylobacter sp. RM12916]MBE3609697.1 ABC transporter permease subunit [Campylobacter sp. RM12916]